MLKKLVEEGTIGLSNVLKCIYQQHRICVPPDDIEIFRFNAHAMNCLLTFKERKPGMMPNFDIHSNLSPLHLCYSFSSLFYLNACHFHPPPKKKNWN